MTMLLLTIHILLAIVTVAMTIKVIVGVRLQKPTVASNVKAMWLSFVGVAISGTALVVITPQSLGHACALMTAFVVVTAGTHLYQRHILAVDQI
ncbi:MAG: hypothetical protein ACHQTE_00290 [Candidatus Saccharimonadales bacterium]